MFGKDKKEEYHEKVLYEAQPNIFVYSKGILISMFVLGFLFFLYSAGVSFIGNMNVYLIESTKVPLTRYFAIAIFIIIMIVIAYIIIQLLIWTSIKYTITESRVIVEKGILFQKKNYMPFNTIQDVSRSQSLLGKMFSVGTITLYSAYDGKDLELKDISSPRKVEDLIFENMRGTHLRYQNIYDDNRNFNPIRPNSDEQPHYRRMEDLDDLELVDVKERKRQERELRRQAKNPRNIPDYNSNYNSDYPRGPNNNYYNEYDDYADYGRGDYGPYDNYPRDSAYRDNRAPRDNYGNAPYGSGGRPDSHHHQYSGAIKESYSRNPDKYFANNYEEFHQSNLDAQRDYDDYVHGRNQYAEDYNPEPPKVEKKSKGLSRFNPFSSNKDDDAYENISDEEFDTTINQAMQDMGDNIKFKPSNDNRFRENPNHYGQRDSNYNQSYHNSHGRNEGYGGRYYDDRHYEDRYEDRYYDGPSQRHQDSRHLRDNYNNSNYDNYGNRYDNRNFESDYRQTDGYRQSNGRNQNSGHYDANRSRTYSGDGEIDYKYKSPRESRKRSHRNSSSHYDSYGDGSGSGGNGKDNKTSEDPFEKHSRKFRR